MGIFVRFAHSARMKTLIFLAASGLLSTGVGFAATPPALIVGAVQDRGDLRSVTVLRLNNGAATERYRFPDRLPADVRMGDRIVAVMLERVDGGDPTRTIAASGFAQMDYRFRMPDGAGAATVAALSLQPGRPAPDQFAVTGGAAGGVAVPTSVAVPTGVAPEAKRDTGNAYVGNLSSYGPIYGVYGPGTNTDARIEIGFKYQLFGTPGDVGPNSPRENGVFFGYRQRLFWDLGKKSSPFRNVEYLPEIFYLVPATPVSDRIALGGQAGARHESNGRDGTASRSLNTLYVQPVATGAVGDLTLSVGPRVWLYAGSLEDNPDIKRYRGNSGLFAEIGQRDGWRLTTQSRMNFGTGKGALDAELSYPLDRLVDTKLNLYLFGQGFVGYGENLFDYTRRTTRLRIGIGFVR
jgi:outer membrane phospholipase A